MMDAHYLRLQANVCLKVAAKIGDLRAEENLRLKAADYLARAKALEGSSGPRSSQANNK